MIFIICLGVNKVVFLIILSILVLLLGIGTYMNFFKARKKGKGISLLVPFRPDGARRSETWHWLQEYWKHELPGAELIVKKDNDDGLPFCKTQAVNNAHKASKGDIVVILDADCYISGDKILDAANRIREAVKSGRKMWFVPYRRFYRINKEWSDNILASDPKNPLRLPDFPPSYMLDEETTSEKASTWGHQFGALIQIMPRKAFELVGGMDERHRSWGGDDVNFMRAVDTLYTKHFTLNNSVYHLWHPTIGKTHTERAWEGGQPGNNDWLSTLYAAANGKPDLMWELVYEGIAER